MTQRATAILQGLIKICRGHKRPMGWQRWQGVLAPVQPLLQGGADGETSPKGLLKGACCRQREIPAMAWAVPSAPGLDSTQLGLSDCVKRTDHTDQSGWREVQITRRCGFWRHQQAPTNNHFSELRSACKPRDQDSHQRRRNLRKCSARHIDWLFVHGRITTTDAFRCITGTRFFSTNSVPNYVSEDGDSHFTLLQEKVAFIAANLRNQLITFIPEPRVD